MTSLHCDPTSPTLVEYNALQVAFEHFNRTLFDNRLPPVLVTLQRKRRSLGYYCPRRFTKEGGETVPEIAMNPSFFGLRSVLGTLSTLVHELTHHQQYTEQRETKPGYHDKVWAQMMLAVGLQPSDTGAPYGKPCGYQMTHYLIQNGPFLRSAQELLDKGFSLVWVDGDAPAAPMETIIAPAYADLPRPTRQQRTELRAKAAALRLPEIGRSLHEPDDDDDADDPIEAPPPREPVALIEGAASVGMDPTAPSDPAPPRRAPTRIPAGEPGVSVGLSTPTGVVSVVKVGKHPGHVVMPQFRGINRSNRVKYRCDGCRAQLWGKPGIEADCRACALPFAAVD